MIYSDIYHKMFYKINWIAFMERNTCTLNDSVLRVRHVSPVIAAYAFTSHHSLWKEVSVAYILTEH
jgi:hypothetical protein